MRASWLAGLLVLLASSAAFAVPTTMNFTGRLSTPSGPVDGNASIQFEMFAASSGGTSLWSEIHNVTADKGLVFVELGTTTPLTDTVFEGSPKYIELTVNGTVLTPRIKITSVPYATRAGISDSADSLGTILPTDVITSVTGTNGVSAQKTGNALAVSLATGGCTTGQVYKYNGTGWACANDANTPTTYTGTAPIAVSGTTISLSTSGCTSGQVLKYNGSSWACAMDTDSAYTGTAPINVTGTTVSLSTSGCTTGQVMKYNGTGWACAADADTTYTGTAPVNITGTTISLSTSGCTSGQVMKYNGTGWACAADTDTTYTGTAPISVTGTVISLATGGCTSGQALKFNGAGFACAADSDTTYTGSAPVSIAGTTISLSACTTGQVLKYNGTNWACGPDVDTAYTGTAPIAVAGNVVSISTGGCTNGQVLKYNGSSWACGPDNDTIVGLAGSGTATTAAHSDHNHTGTYLPVGTTVSCTGSDKVTGLNTTNGNVTCAPDVGSAAVSTIAVPQTTGSAVAGTLTKVITIGTFTKAQAGTTITAILPGALGMNPSPSNAAGYCHFALEVNGTQTPGGGYGLRVYGPISTGAGTGYAIIPYNMTAVFTGLPAGTNTLELWALCNAATSVLTNPYGTGDKAEIVER